MVLIALINYAVIAASDTILDIAIDFTALVIIADFDDIFGSGMEYDKAKEICDNEDRRYDDIFIIETTTSRNAQGESDMKIRHDPVFELVNHNRMIQNIQ